MKNKQESQEVDKYGKITIGEEIKLLIDIIGRSAILELIDKKLRPSYEGKLQRINEGKILNHNVVILQGYCEQFFKGIEREYRVSPLVWKSLKANLKAIIEDFSLNAKPIILGKSKNEIALDLLYRCAVNYICDASQEKDLLQTGIDMNDFKTLDECIIEILPDHFKNEYEEFRQCICDGSIKNYLSDLDMNVFKTTEGKVLEFLTDSYKKVFDDIMQIIENKKVDFTPSSKQS